MQHLVLFIQSFRGSTCRDAACGSARPDRWTSAAASEERILDHVPSFPRKHAPSQSLRKLAQRQADHRSKLGPPQQSSSPVADSIPAIRGEMRGYQS